MRCDDPACLFVHQDGSPDEQQVMDLAAELAEKFDVESLEMFNAVKDVWSNANKSDFSAKRKAKVCVLRERELHGVDPQA